MSKNVYPWVITPLLIILLSAVPLLATVEEDPCREEGMMVRNATMLDLWYKKNGGECSIWVHEHLFAIKTGDSIEIFSDSDCRTLYCKNNPTYKAFKSIDTSGDCRVKILPDCILADM